MRLNNTANNPKIITFKGSQYIITSTAGNDKKKKIKITAKLIMITLLAITDIQ